MCIRDRFGGGVEQRPLERLEFIARVEPELTGEHIAQPLVDLQRRGPSPGPVQGQHQLEVNPLVQRMPGREPEQLPDDLVMAPEEQVRLDPAAQYAHPGLLQAGHLDVEDPSALHIGERGTAPQRQSLAEQVRRRLVVPLLQGPMTAAGEPLVLPDVDRTALGVQQIPAGLGHEHTFRAQRHIRRWASDGGGDKVPKLKYVRL